MDDELRELLRSIDRRLSALEGNSEQEWYTPREVANTATAEGFHKTADTVRCWCSLGQIPFEQADKREAIRIHGDTVEALRANRWRPLQKPDYSSMPASRKARSRRSPSHTEA